MSSSGTTYTYDGPAGYAVTGPTDELVPQLYPPSQWAGGEALDDLSAAVTISLFADRPRGEGSPGERSGHWIDAFGDAGDVGIGSRIWTLDRVASATAEALEAEAREALAWLVEDGVAESVEVSAVRVGRSRLDLLVGIARPTGREELRYRGAWEGRVV